MQRTYDSLDWKVRKITKQLLEFLVLYLRVPSDFSNFCGFRRKRLEAHLGVSDRRLWSNQGILLRGPIRTFISTRRSLHKDGTDSPRLLHHLISPHTCMTSLQGTKIFLPKAFENGVPFPKVGYVSSPECNLFANNFMTFPPISLRVPRKFAMNTFILSFILYCLC